MVRQLSDKHTIAVRQLLVQFLEIPGHAKPAKTNKTRQKDKKNSLTSQLFPQTKTENQKRLGPSNSGPVSGAILEEKGFQDGAENP